MQPRDLVIALAAGKVLSGSALAAHFGLTRAAVWKRVEELRAAGFPIEAVAGQGYRLAAPVELLDAQLIRAQLAPMLADRYCDIQVHWEIDSTNSALLRRAATAQDYAVCLAEQQSAGRGRRGRSWLSPPACNVYLSLLRRFDCGMGALAGLSLAVGVAVTQTVQQCGVREAGLKWPNDVLVGGAKIAGILVELGGEFLGPCHAVIGVGLNVRLDDSLHTAIGQPVVDLARVCASSPARNALVARLLENLAGVLDRFDTDGFAGVQAQFNRLDLLRERALEVSDARGVHRGVGAGVDARGALLLRQDATIGVFDSAEVTVRPA